MAKEEYGELSGEVDQFGERLIKNRKDDGRYHSNWLNMMYPRLKVAKDLLTEDGLIFINIDEHEMVNLQKILTEIFGGKNELGTIIWDKRNPKGDAKGISYQHEYIVGFTKNLEVFLSKNSALRIKKNASRILNKAQGIFSKISNSYTLEDANKEFATWINSQASFSGGEKAYNKIDNAGNVFQSVSMAWPNKKQAPEDYLIPLIHPKTNKACPIPSRGWRNPSQTMRDLLKENLIIFGETDETQPRRKYLLHENMYENIPSVLYYGGSDVALLDKLEIPFETPKAVEVVKEHISSFTKENDIILDFFSGSATTAHATISLNSEDSGSRKYIMVQIPEPTDEKSEAYKAKYTDIAEIGKQRIRLAGDMIVEQNKDKPGIEDLDIGFKVFKTEDTNLKMIRDTISEGLSIEGHRALSKKDRIDFNPHFTDLDVVYEMILRRQDIDLSEEIILQDHIGHTVLVCLEEVITEEMVTKIGEIGTDLSWIIMRDSAFEDNINLKLNTVNLLKSVVKENHNKEQKVYWI